MAAIPLTVLTGYLGSGKTTLLKRLLNDPAMAGTAVIINEFGDVGLDDALVEKTEEDAVLLPSGCVCCQVRGDLTVALAKLHKQALHGEIPPLKRVVLETTGLADPTPIVHTLMTDEETYRVYQLDGVVTTVDGELGMGQIDEHFEPAKQIAIADRIIVTKCDRAPADVVAKLEARLRGLNRGGEIIRVVKGDVAHDRLFGLGAHEPALAGADARKWLALDAVDEKGPAHGHDHSHDHACGPDCGHEHHHHGHAGHGHADHAGHGDPGHVCGPGCDHDHGHAHHDPAHLHGIGAFALTYDKELDGNGLSLALQTMAGSYGEKLLRVKGIVTVAGQARPFVVHGVQHIFYPPDTLKDWPKLANGTADKRSRFVFITKDLPREAIIKHLTPFIGEPN
jgi:G3E family GTPase